MRVNRARLGVAAALAVIGALLPLTAAAAVPAAPVIVAIETLSGGRDTEEPGAGVTNAPIVEVTNVVPSHRITLSWSGPSTGSAICDATTTTVRFNDLTSCFASAFVLGDDGLYAFTATAQEPPAGVGATGPASEPFTYIRDNDVPAPPNNPTTVEQLADAHIRFTFKSSAGDPDQPVASGVESYQILRATKTAPDTFAAFTQVGTLLASTCPTPSTDTCSFTDTTSADGSTYKYAARTVDKAGNVSPGTDPNPNPISGEITADGAGPAPAPAAPIVTPDSTGNESGYGDDATPTIAVTNASGETADIQLFSEVADADPVALGDRVEDVADGATVEWNSGGPVATLPADGAYSITAVLYDSLGNDGPSSDATPYTLDTVDPAAPTIDTIDGQAEDASGNDSSPEVVLSGLSAGDDVTLTVDDANATEPADTFEARATGSTVTYNADGEEANFVITGADRILTLSATVVDQAGNASGTSASKTYTLDTSAPTEPVITSVEGDTESPASGLDRTPSVAVDIAADTARVELYDNDTKVAEKDTSNVTGVTFNAAETDSDFTVEWGEHSFTVKAFDAGMNSATSALFIYDAKDNGLPTTPEPTAKQISGAPGRVFVDWADSTDQPTEQDDTTSPPITYTITRAVDEPDGEGACAATTEATFGSPVNSTNSDHTYQPSAEEVGKCLYFQVKAIDQAGNESPYSDSTSGVKISSTQNPDKPTITSVNGDDTSPAYGTSSGSDKPPVVVTVGELGGTLKLFSDGVQVASKAVTDSTTVTLGAADYSTGIAPRTHQLTAQHQVTPRASALSSSFEYSRSPNPPVFSSVGGDTSSPAKSTDKKPVVNVTGVEPGDTVTLYADGVEVAQTQAEPSGTDYGKAFFTLDEWSGELTTAQEYTLTVKTCDPSIGACATFAQATSAASADYLYERAVIVKGYELDGYGGLHPIGGNASATGGPYFGFDIARDVALIPNSSTAGLLLDGYGGIHSFGGAPKALGGPYFAGFDIARDLVLVPGSSTAGYVLDGFGGIHRFGGAPDLGSGPYFRGFDIARQLILHPTQPNKGWVLDGYGGVHHLGTTPKITQTPYFYGTDVAKSLVVRPSTYWNDGTSPQGYMLDAYGGVHPVGPSTPSAPTTGYTSDPRARRMVLTEPDGTGGYFMTDRGNMPRFGDALPLSSPAAFGFNIGRSLAVTAT